MATRVAVDDSLTPVRSYLLAQGYDVVGLTRDTPEGVAAIVVNGLDDAFMGREDVRRPVPVIDAAGRTPEQVAAAVTRRIAGSPHQTD